jgi:LysM repeat protein
MNQEPNNPKSGIAGKLNMAGWRKHYVAAMTADEEAWPQREPGSNLGRVFVILLLLHVFLIGAVVLYNVIAPKSPPAVATGKAILAKPSATPIRTAASMVTPKAVAVTPAPPAPQSDVKPIETGSYDVRSGDNVPGIAAALGVPAADLIRLNNLDNTELYPGRKLSYPKKPLAPALKAMPVPASAVNLSPAKPETFAAVTPPGASTPPVTLKVNPAVTSADQPPATKPSRKSEPSGGAAKSKADSPPEAPKSAKTTAKTGKAAKTDSTAKTSPKTEKSTKEAAGRRAHVVGPKETLYSIARKYGVKIDALQKANGIKDPTTLREGMKLVIPPKN